MARRLIDLHEEMKRWTDAAAYWRGLGQRAKNPRERERCFLFECSDTNLARVSELDIQAALEAAP